MTTVARFVLRFFLSMAVLGGASWVTRALDPEPGASERIHEWAVSAQCTPVSPRTLPTFQLNHPAGRPVARPKPTTGFPPFPAELAIFRPAPFRASTRLAVRLPRSLSFFLFFFRLVLGHQIAAQAP